VTQRTRRALAWAPAYVCYWVALAFERAGWYRPFNRLMLLSCDLSDWGGVGLWKRLGE